MGKLWQKDWILDKTVEAFETKDDLVLDRKLVKYDVLGSVAHASGLVRIGVLNRDEYTAALRGLGEILRLDAEGLFVLEPGDEDVHTKIENFLTENYGDVGKKIHTGRSRNDQVLTAIRLYTKDRLLVVWGLVLDLASAFLEFSRLYSDELMPGYTHMQKAMPSTVGMWSGAVAEGLLDSLILLKAAYGINDRSPLGSGAGYGVPLPLDRNHTADVLGFGNVQVNPVYCQNSRGKTEAAVVSALVSVFQDLNRFATDVLVFTTSEFGYLGVDRKLCSGSSIMPQKRNVDVAELLRSKVHVVAGCYMQLVGISSNLMSGYNRDAQDGKRPLFESLDLAADSLHAAMVLLGGLSVHRENIRKALTPELFATHRAFRLAKSGMAFRDAYAEAGKHPTDAYASEDIVHESMHLGGTGNQGLDLLGKRLADENVIFADEKSGIEEVWKTLLEGGEKS